MQAVNDAAWQGSEWGVIGSMEEHYPRGAPDPGDVDIETATECVTFKAGS